MIHAPQILCFQKNQTYDEGCLSVIKGEKYFFTPDSSSSFPHKEPKGADSVKVKSITLKID